MHIKNKLFSHFALTGTAVHTAKLQELVGHQRLGQQLSSQVNRI